MSEETINSTMVDQEYGADQIQILEGLEAVRKRRSEERRVGKEC